ncbi:MAG: U-box domain-containing protein, partial [Promethearchaeia archaeon]
MAHGGHAAAAPGAAPASFRCPITGELMREPVVDPEGHTYEKSAIMGWLERNTTSPMTRTYLTADMLKPNRAVQDAIAEMSGPLG